MTTERAKPSWDRLYELASAQQGHFTTAQAREAGYSPQLLAKHLGSGRFRRVRRGVYRLVHFPAGEHEDLVVLWLWSGRVGVFSHETALALHDLSDVLPAQIHLTLPRSWKRRRLRIPRGIVLHHGDIPERARVFSGDVPVTSAVRTLGDCLRAHVAPDLVRQGLAQALERGLLTRGETLALEQRLSRLERIAG